MAPQSSPMGVLPRGGSLDTSSYRGKTMRRPREKTAANKAGERPQENPTLLTVDLGLEVSSTGENEFLFPPHTPTPRAPQQSGMAMLLSPALSGPHTRAHTEGVAH